MLLTVVFWRCRDFGGGLWAPAAAVAADGSRPVLAGVASSADVVAVGWSSTSDVASGAPTASVAGAVDGIAGAGWTGSSRAAGAAGTVAKSGAKSGARSGAGAGAGSGRGVGASNTSTGAVAGRGAAATSSGARPLRAGAAPYWPASDAAGSAWAGWVWAGAIWPAPVGPASDKAGSAGAGLAGAGAKARAGWVTAGPGSKAGNGGPPAPGPEPEPRLDATNCPSCTASWITRHIKVPLRMASSLPGIGYWTRSGSQLVSTTATMGMPILLASDTAMCSFLISIMKTASGRRYMSRMPPRLRSSFSSSLVSISASFLGMASKSPADRMRSYSCIFFTRNAMVEKFVSIPPSQRSLTYGMPHSCAERAIGS